MKNPYKLTFAQFEALSDEQLIKKLPPEWRPFFPGKKICPDLRFYLVEGMVWNFLTGGIEDE